MIALPQIISKIADHVKENRCAGFFFFKLCFNIHILFGVKKKIHENKFLIKYKIKFEFKLHHRDEPFIPNTYESSCLSAWDNCHNIWPLLNICGPPNLVLVQIWIPRIGRLSKALGDESKVVHGHVQEPELYTWSVQPIQHMNQTSEPRDHFSACLVFDRSCLNGSKRRSGLLIEKHSIHVANVQKHLRVEHWHERMSMFYIKAVWSKNNFFFSFLQWGLWT